MFWNMFDALHYASIQISAYMHGVWLVGGLDFEEEKGNWRTALHVLHHGGGRGRGDFWGIEFCGLGWAGGGYGGFSLGVLCVCVGVSAVFFWR